jgi:hypothetical protein
MRPNVGFKGPSFGPGMPWWGNEKFAHPSVGLASRDGFPCRGQLTTGHGVDHRWNFERVGREGGMNEHYATNDNPAPTPSPASHCLQGGSWVLMAMSPHHGMTTVRRGERGEGWSMNKHHAMNRNPASTPSPVSHCSQGGSWVPMATSPHISNERPSTHVQRTTTNDTPSTCYHACEQLLTGWITGAMNATRAKHTKMSATRAKCTKTNKLNETTPLATGPAAMPVSNCSQGG